MSNTSVKSISLSYNPKEFRTVALLVLSQAFERNYAENFTLEKASNTETLVLRMIAGELLH